MTPPFLLRELERAKRRGQKNWICGSIAKGSAGMDSPFHPSTNDQMALTSPLPIASFSLRCFLFSLPGPIMGVSSPYIWFHLLKNGYGRPLTDSFPPKLLTCGPNLRDELGLPQRPQPTAPPHPTRTISTPRVHRPGGHGLRYQPYVPSLSSGKGFGKGYEHGVGYGKGQFNMYGKGSQHFYADYNQYSQHGNSWSSWRPRP